MFISFRFFFFIFPPQERSRAEVKAPGIIPRKSVHEPVQVCRVLRYPARPEIVGSTGAGRFHMFRVRKSKKAKI